MCSTVFLPKICSIKFSEKFLIFDILFNIQIFFLWFYLKSTIWYSHTTRMNALREETLWGKAPLHFITNCVCVCLCMCAHLLESYLTLLQKQNKRKKRHLVVMFSVNAKLFSADAEWSLCFSCNKALTVAHWWLIFCKFLRRIVAFYSTLLILFCHWWLCRYWGHEWILTDSNFKTVIELS